MDSQSAMLSKIDANDLTYIADTSSSLVVERTQKRQQADSPTYNASGNIVVNLQSGVDYIDFTKSMLHLKIIAVGNNLVTRLGGSILDVIDRVKISSRSGTVLTTVDNVNVLNNIKLAYMSTANWKLQQAEGLLGYKNNTQITITQVAEVEYNIPMGFLSGLFEKEQLCPSALSAGLRIEITLASVGTVHDAANPPTNFIVSDVYCNLDSYKLTDPALSILNTMASSKDGLVFEFRDYSSTSNQKDVNVSSFSFESRKTAAIANHVLVTRRTTSDIGNAASDSFKSITYDAGENYQFRVGNLYLPQQNVLGIKSGYAHAAYCLNRVNKHKELGVNIADFTNFNGIMCANLERYYLNLSGLALNNSNSLNLSGSTVAVLAETMNIFMNYTLRAQIFNENVVMSS